MQRSKTSESYQIIWDTVRQIPKGKVATYGEVAKVSGLMGYARLAGYALHNTPSGLKIPWHRVINSQGRISFPRSSHHYLLQKKLLEKEGIEFKKGKIDFSTYGWLRTMK